MNQDKSPVNLKILPKRIYLETLISELRLDHMPILRALKTILLYAEHDGLEIRFDNTVLGIDASVPIGPQYDESGKPIDFEIVDRSQIQKISGPKTIFRAQAFHYERENRYLLSVYSFYHNDALYYVARPTGTASAEVDLALDSIYCDRVAYEEFVEAMETDDKQEPQPASTQHNKSLCSSELKALALLARESAIRSKKFRHGKRVNAAAFKDHIVTLAEKYDKTLKPGLNSLDDKISTALKKYDLKEIPDPDKS